jgi:hypothetical protein
VGILKYTVKELIDTGKISYIESTDNKQDRKEGNKKKTSKKEDGGERDK